MPPRAPPALDRLGGFVYRRRTGVVVVCALLFAVAIAVDLRGGRLSSGGIPSHTEAGRTLKLIRREFPHQGGQDFVILFGSDRLEARDPRFAAAVKAALAPLRADRRVRGIVTPYDPQSPMAATLIGRDGRHALALVNIGGDERAAADAFAELAPRVRATELTALMTGRLAIYHELDELLARGLRRVELIVFPLALVVLLLVFRTVVAALLPLAVAALAVGGAMAAVFSLARVMPVSHYAANIVSMVGLGVAIDYTLFIVSRFREHLDGGTELAVRRALATAGRAVFFSGITVAVGMGGLLFFRDIDTIGIAGAMVVALAVLVALIFLPALLALLGPRIERGRVLRHAPTSDRLWCRLAAWVMRWPIAVLVPTLGLLALLASPLRRLQAATSGVDALPPWAESRRGMELLARDFPDYDPNRIVVLAWFPDGKPLAHLAALTEQVWRIEGLPNVDTVIGPGGDVPEFVEHLAPSARDALAREVIGPHSVVLLVMPRPGATDRDREAIVRAIRAHRDVDGGTLLATGPTAIDLDHRAYIKRHVPAAFAFVTVTMYLVLFALLGSVVLPLKAIVMDALSLTASFGALVWIFEEGHLHRLLGFTPAPIDPVIPVLLFCLAFGLSMDYEVFLLSRIQEEYRRTGDTERAIVDGLARSARLITGAAAIMVVVFGSFVSAVVVPVKAIGLGMAIAVALDATVVRILVVPATMRLLGSLNWWSPPPLARLSRRAHFGEVPT